MAADCARSGPVTVWWAAATVRSVEGGCKIGDVFPRPGYLYALVDESRNLVKIGYTIHPRKRFADIEALAKKPFRCHTVSWHVDVVTEEATMHAMLGNARIEGEWFDLHDEDVAKWLERRAWAQSLGHANGRSRKSRKRRKSPRPIPKTVALTKMAAANKWLTNYLALATNYTALASDIREDAGQYGHTKRTLDRAAMDMKVIKSPPLGGKNTTWTLPKQVIDALDAATA
jgi:hypothetical protein